MKKFCTASCLLMIESLVCLCFLLPYNISGVSCIGFHNIPIVLKSFISFLYTSFHYLATSVFGCISFSNVFLKVDMVLCFWAGGNKCWKAFNLGSFFLVG